MEITFAELTSPGPVRERNEDSIGSGLSNDPEEIRSRGHLMVLADGVAGSGRGDVASRLAVEMAIRKFKEAKPQTPPRQILASIFDAANLAVFDEAMKLHEQGRGVTTLTATILRGSEITIGHVGDCRTYLIQGRNIRQLTTDHSYAGMQVKMGFISQEESMTSKYRYSLTRTVGQNPFVKADLESADVSPGNMVVQCSDGLHSSVTHAEILDTVLRHAPGDACTKLIALAEKRGTDDNLSVQIARIDKVEKVQTFRGLPLYSGEAAKAATREDEVGKVLDDRFEILSHISRGGMASVYKALDRTTGRTVAIKIPFMRFESDPASYGRFEREERIGQELSHPYILGIIRVEMKSRPYIVMELLEGETLTQLMSQVRPLPVKDAMRIASRLCEALEYMHRKDVVHRDMKPQNIMICSDGTLRIMDFGIAKSPDEKGMLSGFSPTMGTPDYMAPEQVQGRGGDERTDLYSLGAILYEMVTGRTPYQGENAFVVMNSRLTGDPVAPSKLRRDIPPELEEIILHAMERDPDLRYQTATAFKSDLDHPELVQVTGRAARLQEPKKWRTNWRRVRAGVIAFGVILLVFLLIYGLAHSKKGDVRHRPWNLGR
jgi:serine/threonine protein phosphatase PrpC